MSSQPQTFPTPQRNFINTDSTIQGIKKYVTPIPKAQVHQTFIPPPQNQNVLHLQQQPPQIQRYHQQPIIPEMIQYQHLAPSQIHQFSPDSMPMVGSPPI